MPRSELILNKIVKQQPLSFADFMQLALYDPEAGYYTQGLRFFGKDFTTAPQLSSLFGYTLAQFCADILPQLSQPILFEFGAGSGRLCIDILTRLEQLQCLPVAYHILEVSGTLQAQQYEDIKQAIPHLLAKVVWVKTWPSLAFEGIILANEVIDAMPVHRFLQAEQGLFELCVGLSEQGELTEVLQPCQNERLIEKVALLIPPDLHPYQSEVNLFVEDWIKQCADMLTRGVMLIIDYGFPRHEYYHPDRHQGTLMCHYQHQAHTDPLLHLGEQDISAHVDFTLIADAALAAGFHVAGYTSQASFLLDNGLLNLVEADSGEQQAVKILLQPNEMGELFKVMALTKLWDKSLLGFQQRDRRASL